MAKDDDEPTIYCDTCMAFSPTKDGDGECRKNPPTQEGLPYTFGTWWCLQWKDKRKAEFQ